VLCTKPQIQRRFLDEFRIMEINTTIRIDCTGARSGLSSAHAPVAGSLASTKGGEALPCAGITNNLVWPSQLNRLRGCFGINAAVHDRRRCRIERRLIVLHHHVNPGIEESHRLWNPDDVCG